MQKNILTVVGITFLFLGTIVTPSTGNISKTSFYYESNNPPYEPSDPIPPDGATNVSIYTSLLCWTGGDPDGDLVIYDVYFGKSNPPPLWKSKQYWNCTALPFELEFNTKYFWKIVAWDKDGSTEGPIWSFTTIESPHNTLYVGGTGPGNYTKIQDAIDNASNGNTVFVYEDSSPYNENLKVDKSITLKGENRETTVINGSSNEIVVNISSDRVTLSGFTIQNYGNDSFYTFLIIIQSDCNLISGNIITGNNWREDVIAYGIRSEIGRNNNISGNIIRECHSGIELVWYSNNISIIGNTFTENTFSISITGFSINGIISLNNISNSTFGIITLNCFNYKITKNNFICNLVDARFFYLLIDTFAFGFEYKSLRDIRSTIKWDSNYWNKPRSFPKPIFGRLPPNGYVPWVNFDWHPAKEPYDI